MKKVITMIALAAISFGSVYAHPTVSTVKSTMQTDTTKKKKTKPMKKDSTSKKKDSTLVKQR
jgi:anionic cell wall polymer biosynthesis LytR-Cps2A-Psr (LCP) family protein